MKLRLQKYLSDAGVASRRQAEELIRAGRVLVNGVVVETLPAFVDPTEDQVVADGRVVRLARHEYFLVNKPKNVVCTLRDPRGRVRVSDLLPPLPVRLRAVAPLDEESTGLLLMTNDGELAQRVVHRRTGLSRTYHAEVRGRVTEDTVAKLKRGVYLSDGRARAATVEVLHSDNDRSSLLISLREGPNRQLRRMLLRLGHRPRKLKRIALGPLTLEKLPSGACRRLTARELAALRAAVARPGREGERGFRPRRPRTRAPGPPAKTPRSPEPRAATRRVIT